MEQGLLAHLQESVQLEQPIQWIHLRVLLEHQPEIELIQAQLQGRGLELRRRTQGRLLKDLIQ